jgi:hypothetical protein
MAKQCSPRFGPEREELMARNMVAAGAHPAVYRRAQDLSRSARRITGRLMPRVALIAALLFSLGLWGVIWLAAASLASVWLR